tara:strand:+ start:22206 stop:22388 length:183 start_codon:yes stop_codon:yes gene_type:complete
MISESQKDTSKLSEPVSRRELNSWRRGFTPQAEIWNGRMAIVGLFFILFVVVSSNSFFAN